MSFVNGPLVRALLTIGHIVVTGPCFIFVNLSGSHHAISGNLFHSCTQNIAPPQYWY